MEALEVSKKWNRSKNRDLDTDKEIGQMLSSMSIASIISETVAEFCGMNTRIKDLESVVTSNGPSQNHRTQMQTVLSDIRWHRWLVLKTLCRLYQNLIMIFDRLDFDRDPGGLIALLQMIVAFCHQCRENECKNAGIIIQRDNLFFGLSGPPGKQPYERHDLDYGSLKAIPIPSWQFFIKFFGWDAVRNSIDWVRDEDARVALGPLENWAIDMNLFAVVSFDNGFNEDFLLTELERLAESLVDYE